MRYTPFSNGEEGVIYGFHWNSIELGYCYMFLWDLCTVPLIILYGKIAFLNILEINLTMPYGNFWYFWGSKISITFCHDVIKFNLLCPYFKEIFFTKWRLELFYTCFSYGVLFQCNSYREIVITKGIRILMQKLINFKF